jgi:hypothetical protein
MTTPADLIGIEASPPPGNWHPRSIARGLPLDGFPISELFSPGSEEMSTNIDPDATEYLYSQPDIRFEETRKHRVIKKTRKRVWICDDGKMLSLDRKELERVGIVWRGLVTAYVTEDGRADVRGVQSTVGPSHVAKSQAALQRRPIY